MLFWPEIKVKGYTAIPVGIIKNLQEKLTMVALGRQSQEDLESEDSLG